MHVTHVQYLEKKRVVIRKLNKMKIRLLLMIAAAGLLVGCGDYSPNCDPSTLSMWCVYPMGHDTTTTAPVKIPQESLNLNGSVRMIREFGWEVKPSKSGNDWVKLKPFSTTTEYYDQRGNLIESYYCCNEDGKCDRHWKAVFDENNDMVYNELTEGNGDTILAFVRTYEYDDVGNLIRETISDDTSTHIITYRYFFTNDSIIVCVYKDGDITSRSVLDTSFRQIRLYTDINEQENKSGRRWTWIYYPNGKVRAVKCETVKDFEYRRYDTCGNYEIVGYEHKIIYCTDGRKARDPNLTFSGRTTRHYEYDRYGNWVRYVEMIEKPKSKRKTEKRYTLYEREIMYW
jgi:hypothetical protein